MSTRAPPIICFADPPIHTYKHKHTHTEAGTVLSVTICLSLCFFVCLSGRLCALCNEHANMLQESVPARDLSLTSRQWVLYAGFVSCPSLEDFAQPRTIAPIPDHVNRRLAHVTNPIAQKARRHHQKHPQYKCSLPPSHNNHYTPWPRCHSRLALHSLRPHYPYHHYHHYYGTCYNHNTISLLLVLSLYQHHHWTNLEFIDQLPRKHMHTHLPVGWDAGARWI